MKPNRFVPIYYRLLVLPFPLSFPLPLSFPVLLLRSTTGRPLTTAESIDPWSEWSSRTSHRHVRHLSISRTFHDDEATKMAEVESRSTTGDNSQTLDPVNRNFDNQDLGNHVQKRYDHLDHNFDHQNLENTNSLRNSDTGIVADNLTVTPLGSPPQNVSSTAVQPDKIAYHRHFNSLKFWRWVSANDVTLRRHQNTTSKYRVFHGGISKMSSAVNLPESVNLMIIPLSAIFIFIVICVIHVSRWCIEGIREADGIQAKRYPTTGFIPSCSVPLPRQPSQVQNSSGPLLPVPRRSYPNDYPDGGRSCGAHSTSDLARLSCRNRLPRQTRIVPARSTRSLNGIRDRNCERTNRKLAVGSDSSIQMMELSSRYPRHVDRNRGGQAADGIVENCKRAVGSFLQSHVIVVPVDRSIATGSVTIGPRTRTRNFSSPSSSKTGSSCSESRPLLARCSSSSDGRMTSSDSNIDVMSPMSIRRRLAGETRYRTKPACVNSAGNLPNRIAAFQHGRHPGKSVGYSHQSSAPAVSKLVHESLNLSFRFFQVPLYSDPSSGKESLDSVFVCGIYTEDMSAAGNDALLKPETEGYDGPEMSGSSRGTTREGQPMPSNDGAQLCTVFDRQDSVDEPKDRESCQTLIEELELEQMQSEIHLPADEDNNKILDSEHGVTLRRSRSANELQFGHLNKETRYTKCRTT